MADFIFRCLALQNAASELELIVELPRYLDPPWQGT